VFFQAFSEMLWIAVVETENRPAGQTRGLEHAVVREFIDEHGVELILQHQRQNMVPQIAGREIERIFHTEKRGGLTFHVERGREIPEGGPRVRAADAVLLGRLAGRPDHLRVSLKPQVSGPGEVEVPPAVDHGMSTGWTLHSWHRLTSQEVTLSGTTAVGSYGVLQKPRHCNGAD